MTKSISNRQHILTWLICIVFIAGILSCNQDSATDSKPAESSETDVDVKPGESVVKKEKFNRDSAYHFIKTQVEFGPRVPNTREHTACRDWLAATLGSYGAEVKIQDFRPKTYDGVTLRASNIIGSFNPAATKRMLLAAHWDSRRYGDYDEDESRWTEPILGADDGGSGVGVLLEIARLLSMEDNLNVGVDIVFFDAEDQGKKQGGPSTEKSWCLGAQHWSKYPHKPGYKAEFGILLDMVGSKNARFPKEGYSVRFAPQIVEKVWSLAHEMGYSNYFYNVQEFPLTDDHKFINEIAGIPTIDIINKKKGSETGFGDYWHTHDDNMKVIDKRTLNAVGKLVTRVIRDFNDGEF